MAYGESIGLDDSILFRDGFSIEAIKAFISALTGRGSVVEDSSVM